MTDREALVAGVAARPADDVVRLVFADWFEEHGHPERAAFVRAECAAARARPGSFRRAAELDRADDLRFAHARDWLGPWADRLIDWEFARGFVSRVRLTSAAFLAHGEDLFRTEPVGRVELVSESGEALEEEAVRVVVAHPAFAHVRDCAIVSAGLIETTPIRAWMAAIAANPHVSRLERFEPTGSTEYDNPPDIRSDRLDKEMFAAFCRAKHLTGLRELILPLHRFGACDPRPWLVEHMARSPFAPILRRLTLTGCDLPAQSFRRIATDPAFGNLRALDLSENPGAADGLPHVFASRTLSRLRTLAVPADQLPAYAASPVARQVRNLTVNYAGDRNLSADRRAWLELLRAAPPPRRLTLNYYSPGRKVFAAMRRAKWLRDVRTLSISGASQYEVHGGRTAGLQALFAGNAMPRLSRLQLHHVIGETLRERLCRWPGLARVEDLELTNNYSGRMPAVKMVPLGRTRTLSALVRATTDADLDAFIATPGLESVRDLKLWLIDESPEPNRHGNAITPAAVDRLLFAPVLQRLTRLTIEFFLMPRQMETVLRRLADPAVLPRLESVTYFADGLLTAVSDDAVAVARQRFGHRLQTR